MNASIAVLEGDGIGPEIVAEALKVLDAVAERYGHRFTYRRTPFGAGAYFSCGAAFPAASKEVCDSADAILKGPAGVALEEMRDIPVDQRPELAILELRQRYNTFANYRPVVLPGRLAGLSPLRPEVIGDGVDILMIRELVGGIYFGEKVEREHTQGRYASDDCRYTREQVEQVAEVAFGEARTRSCHLTVVHKANILATSRLWEEVVEQVAERHSGVDYSFILVDNAAFQLAVDPAQFNGVMLLENMQGDILRRPGGRHRRFSRTDVQRQRRTGAELLRGGTRFRAGHRRPRRREPVLADRQRRVDAGEELRPAGRGGGGLERTVGSAGEWPDDRRPGAEERLRPAVDRRLRRRRGRARAAGGIS